MKEKNELMLIGLLVIVTALLGINQYLISSVMPHTAQAGMNMSGDLSQDAVSIAINQGVPKIYGEELGINFDETQAAIAVMQQFDPGYGKNKIVLQGEKMQRYVDITTKIACEFCCSAKALSFADGKPACGCAHAQSMRGLAAYLLQNHGESFSNDEVLRELSRWKGRYFPKQMTQKVISQISSGNYTPEIAALVMGMDVSGYTGSGAPVPSEISNLPDMVGGC